MKEKNEIRNYSHALHAGKGAQTDMLDLLVCLDTDVPSYRGVEQP